MIHFQARQLDDKSGWHFTCRSDGAVWPVGYCDDPLHRPHATREEAEACMTGYMLDEYLKLDGHFDDQQRRCEECGAWTQGYARIDATRVVLCDEHRTRAMFAGHWTAPTAWFEN